MFTCKAIPSIRYYLDGPEANSIGYYTDDADGESQGIWWKSNPGGTSSRTAFKECKHGTVIDREVFARLCEGSLADGRRVSRAGGIRRPAYDLHFAAPKSVSLLAMFLSRQNRRAVQAAHDRAVRRALKFCFEHGLIETRSGQAGREREAAEEFVAAIFRHNTSRANDPQLHSHCPVPNIALKADGSVGATDNKKLLKFQRLVGAIYSAELAAGLRELGYEIEVDGKAFKVKGVPDALCALFSKRRKMIESLAKARGFDPSLDRGRAQQANLETRSAKTAEPSLKVLRQAWLDELESAGFSLKDFPVPSSQTGAPLPELGLLVQQAVDWSFEHDSVLPQPKLAAMVAEHLQWRCNADQVEFAVTQILPRHLVNITPNEPRLEQCLFTTPAIVAAERSILDDAVAGKSLRTFVPAHHIEAAIASRPTLSEEQKAAVRHALNSDQFSIFEGAAGAGKSFAGGAMATAGESAGMKTHALGPSWSAANVLARDTKTPRAQTRALLGFVNDAESGKLHLTPRDLLLLDEGSLADIHLLARLTAVARSSGCKVVISGDTRQLQPVGAGAPLALLIRALGSARINEVRRQQHGWARAASMRFGRGLTDEALIDYDARGHIDWCTDSSTAIESLADRYMADLLLDQTGSEPPPTSLVITAWNEDVGELNRQIRLRLQAEGSISQSQVDIGVFVRDRGRKKPAVSSLPIAAGDRVVFGETVNLKARTIRNADVAKILAIEAGANPRITLEFEEDGQRVTASLSELVGYREEKEPKLPLLRHAYCVTVNFAQGMTVDRAYVAALRPMSAEAIYVAMTRHRHAAQLYVDTSRFAGRVMAGKLRPASLSTLKAAFYRECKRPARKLNVTDLNPSLTRPQDPIWQARTASWRAVKRDTYLRMVQRAQQGFGQAARLDEPASFSGVPNALFRQFFQTLKSRNPGTTTPSSAITEWLAGLRDSVAQVLRVILDRREPEPPQRRGRPRFSLRPRPAQPKPAPETDGINALARDIEQLGPPFEAGLPADFDHTP